MKNIILILSVLLPILTSCATPPFQAPAQQPTVHNEAELASLETEAKKQPDNLVLRAHLLRQKDLLVNQLCEEAAQTLFNGNVDESRTLYDRVLKLDPASPRANAGKQEIEAFIRHREWIAQAEKSLESNNTAAAEQKLRSVLVEDPQNARAKALLNKIASQRESLSATTPSIKSSYSKPITLEFRDASVRSIFEIISRTGNLNFIFDKDVKGDQKATIFVRNVRIEDAIKILLTTNQLEQKILGENTVLIFPATATKLKEYQELIVRSFYLQNASAKEVATTIKTIVKTNDIDVDEKLNMIIVRDTPDAISMIEKLIAARDIAEPEVMLEMEVLEVSRNKLQDLGIRYPQQLSVSAEGKAGGGTLTLEEWKHINSGMIQLSVTNPSLILNLKKIDTDTNLLANPRVRVRNREDAKIHIGERVPVISTTSTANVGISDSVSYVDVGLKLDIVPNVFLDDEVAMKVSLDVSNIIEKITTTNGTQTYRFGTRNTSTTLRIKNGETQILAGLIQNDQRRTANKVPGLSSLPLLGRLFTDNSDDNTKTEIVLLITPHVIRNIIQPEIAITQFSSGTADSVGREPVNYNALAGKPTPVTPPSVTGNISPVTPPPDNPALPQGLQPNLPKKVTPVTSSPLVVSPPVTIINQVPATGTTGSTGN